MTPPYLRPPISCVRLTENCINREGVECLIEALQNNTLVKSIWCVMMSEETQMQPNNTVTLILSLFKEKFQLHMKVTDPLCLSLLNWQAEKQQPQFRGSRGDDTT